MKNNQSNSFYYFIIGAMILLNAYTLYTRYKLTSEITEIDMVASDKNSKLKAINQQYDLLKKSYFSFFKGPIDFNKNKSVYNSGKNNKLVLRIHQNDCNTCVDATIKILEEYRKQNSIDVTIVSDYVSVNSMKRDFKTLPYPIVLQKKFELDIPGDTSPFIFVLDANNKSNYVFFPNWMSTDLLRKYFDELRAKNII